MSCTTKQSAAGPPKSIPTITERDIDFISFSLDEHIRLAEMKLGCTWEANVSAEKEKAYSTVCTLQAVSRGKAKLDDEVMEFIEFSMTERCDFAVEGFGSTWCKDGQYESIKTAHIIGKLRRICAACRAATLA